MDNQNSSSTSEQQIIPQISESVNPTDSHRHVSGNTKRIILFLALGIIGLFIVVTLSLNILVKPIPIDSRPSNIVPSQPGKAKVVPNSQSLSTVSVTPSQTMNDVPWVWKNQGCGSQAPCIYHVCSSTDQINCYTCSGRMSESGVEKSPTVSDDPTTTKDFQCTKI